MCLYQVGRTEDFQKCKAICDLLKIWYQKDDSMIGDEIISLGVASDGNAFIIMTRIFHFNNPSLISGTFNFPTNLFFSQPVHLKVQADNSRVWVPYSEFPIPSGMETFLQNFVETAIIILRNMNLIE